MTTVVLSAICGALVASVVSCLPGLHIYNLLAVMAIAVHMLAAHAILVPPEIVVPLMFSMMVGFAMVNTIPSVLLAAPDESAIFMVLPGQKYLMTGRGYEGTMLTGAGGLAGLFVILLLVGPIAPRVLPLAYKVFQPHTHWIVWTVICFMLMSEWPKGGRLGQAGWRMFFDGWKTTGAGLATFILAGLLGFVLLYRSPVSTGVAFQNLMPAFVGLFTIPWLLLNLAGGVDIPEQRIACRKDSGYAVLQGAFAGTLGGGFAAFFPVITGGVGGLLSGHATALRDDRVFLASQGASKLIYYVGGLLLFFVPGVQLTRGGGAWMMRGMYIPHTSYDYYMALASIAIAGAVSFLMLSPLTRAMIALMGKIPYRRFSAGALALILVLVFAVTGWMGMFIMVVATGIGLMPVMLGSRRMNCLAVILLPMACNMSGVGSTVAKWLGLI